MSENVTSPTFGSGVDQTFFFPELHTCTAFPDSRGTAAGSSSSLQRCCPLLSATSLLVSFEPGGQEGAKVNQRNLATFLTCSRSSSKIGLRVVKVLIRTAGENLGCGTATFLTLTNQQSFASEKRGVKLTERVVFFVAQ